MKVCAKCGWQNEDEESKCFQCYADLTIDAPASTSAEHAEAPIAEEPPQKSAEGPWNDPDLRPIEHDTPLQELSPQSTAVVRVVEEQVVTDDDPSPGRRMPMWAVAVAIAAVIILFALFNKSSAKGPEGSPKQAVSQLMDAVVARNTEAAKAAVSRESQRLAGMAPLVLGSVLGRAIASGAQTSYTIGGAEEKDKDIVVVYCEVTAQQPTIGYGSSQTLKDTVPIFARVENGRWVADLQLTAMRQVTRPKSAPALPGVPLPQ